MVTKELINSRWKALIGAALCLFTIIVGAFSYDHDQASAFACRVAEYIEHAGQRLRQPFYGLQGVRVEPGLQYVGQQRDSPDSNHCVAGSLGDRG